MSVIKDVISEEKDRLISLISFYQSEIEKLPKGYISPKKRNDGVYYYISYRDGSKVRSKYIGKSDSDNLKELIIAVKKRKDLESKLKQARVNLKEVQRMLNG